MGTATAGAIIETLEGLELEDEAVEEDEGEEVEAGAATMLDLDVVKVLEPPSDLVTTEVRMTTLVDESGALWLFASTEPVVLPGVPELAESGLEEDEDVWPLVTTEAAESEKALLDVEGGLEDEAEEAEEAEEVVGLEEVAEEDAESLEEEPEGALPIDETTTPLLSEKRSLEVLQQPRLASPPASGRLASQQ